MYGCFEFLGYGCLRLCTSHVCVRVNGKPVKPTFATCKKTQLLIEDFLCFGAGLKRVYFFFCCFASYCSPMRAYGRPPSFLPTLGESTHKKITAPLTLRSPSNSPSTTILLLYPSTPHSNPNLTRARPCGQSIHAPGPSAKNQKSSRTAQPNHNFQLHLWNNVGFPLLRPFYGHRRQVRQATYPIVWC